MKTYEDVEKLDNEYQSSGALHYYYTHSIKQLEILEEDLKNKVKRYKTNIQKQRLEKVQEDIKSLKEGAVLMFFTE